MSGILVTGSSGFLGNRLTNFLLKNSEFQLYLTLHENPIKIQSIAEFENRVTLIDLNSESALNSIFERKKINKVIHCATKYGKNNESICKILDCNLILPLKILELSELHGIDHFINIDSYFNKPEVAPNYLPNYIFTKKSLNNWLQGYSGKFNVTNLIIEHMYGPGDSLNKFVPILINEAKNGFKSNLKFSPGKQIRDFVYVDDVVKAISFLINLNEPHLIKYQEFEVGTGVPTDLIKLFSVIQQILGTNIPAPFGSDVYRKNEIMRSVANIKPLADLGWTSKIDLKDGLERTISWLQT